MIKTGHKFHIPKNIEWWIILGIGIVLLLLNTIDNIQQAGLYLTLFIIIFILQVWMISHAIMTNTPIKSIKSFIDLSIGVIAIIGIFLLFTNQSWTIWESSKTIIKFLGITMTIGTLKMIGSVAIMVTNIYFGTTE